MAKRGRPKKSEEPVPEEQPVEEQPKVETEEEVIKRLRAAGVHVS